MDGNLKKSIQSAYPFFDGNALDAARFIFGAECDEVISHDGWMTVDEEVETSDMEEEDFDSELSGGKSSGPILEGSRNNTMSRFAGRVLKRYGDTKKAHEEFLDLQLQDDMDEVARVESLIIHRYMRNVGIDGAEVSREACLWEKDDLVLRC